MDFRSLNLIFWLIFVCAFPVKGKEPKSLSNISSLTPLRGLQGYLVVYIDVSGVAPSIEFSRINTRKLDVIPQNKKIKFANQYIVSLKDPKIKLTSKYTINLKDLEKGFYYLPLIEGVYQVTKVNVPFYDLPYWLPTENASQWRFSIHRGKFNFIGELNVAKERSTNVVDVNLYNRIATYQEQLKKELKQVQGPYELIATPGYRDEFFEELER